LARRKGVINAFAVCKLPFRADQGAPLPSQHSCSITVRDIGAGDGHSRGAIALAGHALLAGDM